MKFTEQTVNEYSEAWCVKHHCILAMNRLGTVSESVKLCNSKLHYLWHYMSNVTFLFLFPVFFLFFFLSFFF